MMFPVLSLVLLAASVSANTVFSSLSVNGVDQGHAVGIRVPTSNAPVIDLSSPNLICNTDFIQPVSQTIIQVPAGANVTAQFHHYSAGYLGPDPSDPLDPYDKGPILAYLAAVPSALQNDVSGLAWFKIYEDGYTASTGQWASDRVYINNGSVTFTIPSCIASGDYLLRVEDIGLVNATSYPGAQFYMSCAQLHITNSASVASTTPDPMTSIPGVYKSTDPGIVTSLFGLSSYPIPGPAVFTC